MPPGTQLDYEQANAFLRYTMQERFQHLTLFLAGSTGIGTVFFLQPQNLLLQLFLSFSGVVVTLILWIMQWRAVWRMHILMHIVQSIEQDPSGFWGQVTSVPRPLWLGRIGDTEATTFLFFLATFIWTFLSITTTYQFAVYKFSLPELHLWTVNGVFIVITLTLSLLLLRTLRTPSRKLRHLQHLKGTVPGN